LLGSILARGFFFITHDSAPNLEKIPLVVEVDGSLEKDKLEAIKKGLVKTGVEVVTVKPQSD